MVWGLSFGMLSLTGCGEPTPPAAPIGKSKDESQKESEQLPGVPVYEGPKPKKRRR